MKSEKILLPNGCSCSKPSVFPKDWKTCNKSALEKDWRIQYYFYDPNFPKPKFPTVVKGMNEFRSLTDRRAITKTLYDDELQALKDGYNPYLKKFVSPVVEVEKPLMNPDLPIIEAFNLAKGKLEDRTKEYIEQIGYAINRIEKSAASIGMVHIKISELKRSQLKELFDDMKLPNDYFNKFKAYFSTLFKKLIEYECCETNLTRDISKRIVIKKQREVLEVLRYDLILDYLRVNFYSFYRYGKIFFYSGARTSELFSVQAKHVRLEKQEYDVLILKGGQYAWETKVIIQNAIPFWTEVLKMCKSKEDYLFSYGLVPGSEKNNPRQITIRWRTHVKEKLVFYNDEVRYKTDLDEHLISDCQTITADFYSMKHAFLDLLDEKQNDGTLFNPDQDNNFNAAQGMGSHRTPTITHKVYTTGKNKRTNERLKKITV